MGCPQPLLGITGPTPSAFRYDALGRRVGRTVSGATTVYLHDGLNVLREHAGSAITTMLTGLGIDEHLMRTHPGGIEAVLADALRSTVALTDGAGEVATEYTYEPFGITTITGQPTDNSFTYTGREDDATGLKYYRARYYHPTLQRFVSEDPIGLVSGDTNFYVYVGNSPLSFIDPLGLDKKTCPTFGDRYLAHLNTYLIDVGPSAALLAGGLWPKSLAPATRGRGPLLGSNNPLTSVPRAVGIAGAGSAVARTGAAGIGIATVGIGYYNVGVFTSGLGYAAFPGWNGLPVQEGCE